MGRLHDTVTDPERRSRLLFWIWILSLVVTVVGYLIIFLTLLRT